MEFIVPASNFQEIEAFTVCSGDYISCSSNFVSCIGTYCSSNYSFIIGCNSEFGNSCPGLAR